MYFKTGNLSDRFIVLQLNSFHRFTVECFRNELYHSCWQKEVIEDMNKTFTHLEVHNCLRKKTKERWIIWFKQCVPGIHWIRFRLLFDEKYNPFILTNLWTLPECLMTGQFMFISRYTKKVTKLTLTPRRISAASCLHKLFTAINRHSESKRTSKSMKVVENNKPGVIKYEVYRPSFYPLVVD